MRLELTTGAVRSSAQFGEVHRGASSTIIEGGLYEATGIDDVLHLTGAYRLWCDMAVRNVALFILYTASGRLLLQHRTPDAPRLPNYWAFFGGGIEPGEHPSDALKREVREELSYHVQDPYFLTTQVLREGEDENTKYVFVERYEDQPLELGEGQAMGWFLPDETHDLQMVDHDRAIVERVRQYLRER